MKIFKLFLISILFTACYKTKSNLATLPKHETSQKKEILAKKQEVQIQKSQILKSESSELQDDIKQNEDSKSPRISAVIKTDNNSILSFQVSGVIKNISLKPGDRVKKNELLSALDGTHMNLEIKRMQIDLSTKQVILQQAETKFKRYQALLKQDTVSQSTFEDIQNEFRLAKLNFEAAQLNLQIKKYEFSLTELKAPYAGTITKLYKSIGDYAMVGAPIFELIQSEDLIVFAQFPSSFFEKVKIGMKFKIYNPIQKLTEIMEVDKLVSVIDPKTHTFDVYGKVKNKDHIFVPGMYVEIILD